MTLWQCLTSAKNSYIFFLKWIPFVSVLYCCVLKKTVLLLVYVNQFNFISVASHWNYHMCSHVFEILYPMFIYTQLRKGDKWREVEKRISIDTCHISVLAVAWFSVLSPRLNSVFTFQIQDHSEKMPNLRVLFLEIVNVH